MTLTTITLNPYAQDNGYVGGEEWEIIDAPSYFGSGSVSDGSDTSGATIGAEFDILSQHHGEPIATWFKTPPNFDPFAMLIQTRMRNTAEALAYTLDATRAMVTELSSADNTTQFDHEFVSPGGSNPAPVSDVLLATIGTPTDFTWYGSTGAASIDLDNPSEAGGWYQLDWSFNRAFGDKEALTGDGLRLDLGLYFVGAAGDPHVDWFDLFEVSLLVAGTVVGGSPPLRRYPRSDGLGVGPRRHYPPTSYRQTSTRRGVGNS